MHNEVWGCAEILPLFIFGSKSECSKLRKSKIIDDSPGEFVIACVFFMILLVIFTVELNWIF